jgi:hypothetical protein
MKDVNYLFNLEKSIKEKFGEEAIKNPKANWDPTKEAHYLAQLKELSHKEQLTNNFNDFMVIEGVLLPAKLFTKENNRICLICSHYSISKGDDVYLNKFKTCFKCFVNFVEDREEKWLIKLQEKDLKR